MPDRGVMRDEAVFVFVEAADLERPEVDCPVAIGQRRQANALPDERFTDEDAMPAPLDRARAEHGAYGARRRIVEGGQTRGVRTSGRGGAVRRRLVAESRMRAVVVVLAHKRGTGVVRCAARRRRRERFLQRPMKAFVAPVLLRFAGRDALGADPELHPPGRQAREAREAA